MGVKVKFNINNKNLLQILEFVIEGGVLSPTDLKSISPPSIDSSKTVVLSGRGPLWLYGYLVHHYHFVKRLCTFEPRLGVGIVISSASNSELGKGVDLESGELKEVSLGAKGKLKLSVEDKGKLQLLKVQIEGDRFIEPSQLSEIVQNLPEVDQSKPIVLHGLMPVWLCAFLTEQYVHKCPWFGVYDPRLKGAVVVARHSTSAPEVGEVVPIPEEKRKTIVIAIAGDPNSGKSVFLHLLNDVLRKKGLITLTQEGDLFAPTQHWSLFAPEIRRNLKKYQDPTVRLSWITSSLRKVKESKSVDIVLVDIGGGRPDLGIRVTPENLAILQWADLVVIVSRNDSGQIEAWKKELSEKVPHVKVVAELESVYNPEGKYDFSAEGKVWHLDRTAYANKRIPEPTWKVVEKVAEKIISFLR